MNQNQAFKGLKVADFSQGVAGPYCGMMLAQGGASVTKVEPTGGDWARTLGTTYGEYCAHAIVVNLGKKSISIDLKNPEGLALARKIAEEADVVLESFRPGVMKKFGLDYDSVSKNNSNVIYLSVTGYGQEGPYSTRPVTDSAIQGFSGWMSITRDENGMPMKSGMVVIDFLTGLFAYQSVMKALIGRGVSGEGAYIDCNLMQAAAAFQSAKILEHHLEGGSPNVLYVPAGTVQTADGYVGIAVMREGHYAELCKVLGREDLIDHEDYNSREKRVVHEKPLMAEIRREFLRKTTAQWSKELEAAGVIHSPINGYADYLENEQSKAVNSYSWIDHEVVGKIPLPRIPGFDGFVNGSELAHSPLVGEHSDQVLEGLGLSEAEIAALKEKGAVFSR
ncbi:CaiB/BaiF CoA transferase family protein [Sneathiella chinensis]|uniref:CoA transferase n=1 Tax=Sneathiella chinensis TaxID=349750 RepID=A0ABQ5U3Y8_9PROT|nr:CoA transferase [Sneathiella chinensis]GLQ06887.1 CoA transferase [Sneathiella chinensis]